MKNYFFIGVCCLLHTVGFAQTTKPFTVTGTLNQAKPGSYVYLETNGQRPQKLDSAKVLPNHSFTLKGKVNDGGDVLLLNTGDGQRIGLLVEGGETLTVSTAKDQPQQLSVTGSKNMQYYGQLMNLRNEFDAKTASLNQQYQAAAQNKDQAQANRIEAEFQKIHQDVTEKVKAMLPDMGTSLATLFALNFLNIDQDFATYETVAQRFQKEKPTNPHAQALISQVNRVKNVQVGGLAPDITLTDTTGKTVALSSLRGKYVLIDFWASWCGPCRAENPNVVNMYSRFKDKGFTIYGVSLDRNKADWTKAIRNDRLAWTHVSDLKFWQSQAAQLYGVQAIPATFLLDKEGKIIAKNLRGQALEQKLDELLK